MLLLLFSIFLVSCGDVTVTLDTPQNVVITNGVVTWDAVTGADSYVVVVDSNSQTVTVTSFDLKTLNLTAGDHTVQVVAQSGTEVSMPSTSLNYTVQASSLGAPQNVAIANGVVTWNAVTGATAYVVHVDSATYEVTVRTYNLNSLSYLLVHIQYLLQQKQELVFLLLLCLLHLLLEPRT